MGIVQQVRDYLAADATLAALLPGGLYAGGEITRQATPAAFDANGELRPCGLVNSVSDTPDGPTHYAGRMLISVWLYHRSSDAALETAVARVKTLLHKHVLPGTFGARWAFDTTGFREEALEARAAVTRYEVIRMV